MADPNYYIVYNTLTDLPKGKYFESIRNIKLNENETLIPCAKDDDMSNTTWLLSKVNDPNRNLALAKEMRKTLVADLRREKEQDGFAYVFPDGPGVIQTRDEVDFRNINGLVSMALILLGNSDTTTQIGFRDMFNGTHMMTAPQLIQMGIFVNTAVSNLYSKSWVKKAEIDACTTIEQVDAVDINTGW